MFDPIFMTLSEKPRDEARALSKSTRISLHKVGWEEVLQTMPVPFLAEKKHNHKSVLKIGKLVKT